MHDSTLSMIMTSCSHVTAILHNGNDAWHALYHCFTEMAPDNESGVNAWGHQAVSWQTCARI